jgi:hypothetical protein
LSQWTTTWFARTIHRKLWCDSFPCILS